MIYINFIDVKEALPDDIPTADDDRWFIFVDINGDPITGFHIKGNIFKSSETGVAYDAIAWIQWEESKA